MQSYRQGRGPCVPFPSQNVFPCSRHVSLIRKSSQLDGLASMQFCIARYYTTARLACNSLMAKKGLHGHKKGLNQVQSLVRTCTVFFYVVPTPGSWCTHKPITNDIAGLRNHDSRPDFKSPEPTESASLLITTRPVSWLTKANSASNPSILPNIVQYLKYFPGTENGPSWTLGTKRVKQFLFIPSWNYFKTKPETRIQLYTCTGKNLE